MPNVDVHKRPVRPCRVRAIVMAGRCSLVEQVVADGKSNDAACFFAVQFALLTRRRAACTRYTYGHLWLHSADFGLMHVSLLRLALPQGVDHISHLLLRQPKIGHG